MTEKDRTTGSKAIIVTGLLPYVAVLIGMYWLNSGWTAMLLYHAGICLILALSRNREMPKRILQGFDARLLLALTPVYLSAGVIIFFFWPVAKLDHVVLAEALRTYGLDPGNMWGFIVYYCLINSVLEELFWRDFLGSPAKGPTLGDLLFSGYHGLVMALFVSWFWVVVTLLMLVAGAWIWRTVARYFRGLAMPWLTHMVADTGIMVAVYLLVNK